MENILHRSPSVGAIVKKIMTVNPDLGVPEIIAIIRKATIKKQIAGDFSSSETVDEKLALDLASKVH